MNRGVGLNPIILDRLEQFRRRRRRLILLRGICSAVVSFLVLMSLVAVADWVWILSDSVRWVLSAIGYLGAAVAVWFTSARLMFRIPSHRELARRMEAAEPGLRENLLAAVELSAEDSAKTYDSPVFRRLVQNQVARQVDAVRVPSLLPARLVRPWLIVAALVLILCGLLFYLPDLPYRQLLSRAILPGANIDRVSRVQVTILEPTPHSLTVPQDDTVAIVVETSGGEVREATLETSTATHGAGRLPMPSRGASQFAANLSIGADPVEYRILAGDAVTRKYTIRSRPRPRVLAFHKTYRYPPYAGIEDKQVSEPHGDLIALEGSEAGLVLELDQEVAEAEIRLEQSGVEEIRTIGLIPDGQRRLRATLPMDEPGIYKVHLQAKETCFENTFSPKYEIRPEPDLIPRVGFVGRQDTTLLLPPNDILPLEALAEDDLPLVGLEQHLSVNGRPWQKVPLEIEKAARVTTAWNWDLLGLSLKSGDQVTTKLVASDRKGNTGESIPLSIVIAPPDFDPERHMVMQRKAALYDKLAELAGAIQQRQVSTTEILQPLVEQDPPAPAEDVDARSLVDLAGKNREETDSVYRQILEILPKMPAGADAEELELSARVLARIAQVYPPTAEVFLEAASKAEGPEQVKESLQRVRRSFDQSAEDAGRLAEGYRNLVAHNILASIAMDLDGLLKQQRRLLAPGAPLPWERMLRQETVAINQIRSLEQIIRGNLARLPSSAERGVRGYLDWMIAARERLEAVMESEDQAESLRKTAEALLRELEGRQNVLAADQRLPASILQSRKDLDQRAGSLFAPLEQLAGVATDIGRYSDQATRSNDSTESRRWSLSAEQAAAELKKLHVPGTAVLTSRKNVAQARPDCDARYAADAGLTRRALTALLDRYAGESPSESEVPAILAQVAGAYRILESGHEAVQIRSSLASLLSREQWDSQQVASRLDHPRQWDAVFTGFETVSRKLKEAGYPSELVARIDQLRRSPPAQDAARKINVRRYRLEPLVGAAYELTEVEEELDAVLKAMEPTMADARALIAQYVPTIPEMAAKASQELRELEEQTAQLAQNPSKPDAETAPRLDEIRQEQRQVNQRLEDLTDALVEDANAQDPLTDEGRRRARDADDATAMIREPAARMNQAIRRATDADQPPERSRELTEAARQQDREAEALDQIAEHYRRLASGEDVAETREALRQAERELGLAKQMDERYSEAERLGEMAEKTPQQLLAELEAQLPQNPEMQEALSDIGRDALEQAKAALEDSAQREADMRRTIEQSDRDFQAKKKALVEAVREVAQEASDLSRTLVAQADSAASSGKAPEARETLQDAQRRINEAFAESRSTSDDRTLKDVMEAARKVAENLTGASEELAEAKDLTAKAEQEDIHENQPQRAAQRRDFESAQQRFHEQRVREANERVSRSAKAETRAVQQSDSAEDKLAKAERQVEEAREAVERKRQPARQSLEQTLAKRDEARSALRRAQEALEQARQKARQAEQTAKQLAEKKLEPLESPNPAAQLAHRFTEEAAGAAEQLAARAKALAEEPAWSKDLDPAPQPLAQAVEQQKSVGEDVAQAAEDVARAARHEGRLGKPAPSAQLDKTAKSIQNVAEGEVSAARQKLAEASAGASPDQASQPEKARALAARDAVEEAQNAISSQVDALSEALRPSDQQAVADAEQVQADAGESAEPAAAASPPPSPSPAKAVDGRLLARTLDELDRRLSASPPADSPTGLPQPQLNSLAQAAQAEAATMNQARMSADSRQSLEGSTESNQGAALVDMSAADLSLPPVRRDENGDWGKLREQSAEDLTEGRRESLSAEYRKRIETYFRVIGERARKKP